MRGGMRPRWLLDALAEKRRQFAERQTMNYRTHARRRRGAGASECPRGCRDAAGGRHQRLRLGRRRQEPN